jgi:aminocarboxymuconate-semialdehyde decarboxylase
MSVDLRHGTGTIDLHAHLFPPGLPAGPGGYVWPSLHADPDDGRIMLGDWVFRKVAPTLWSLPQRIDHLDEHGVDVQLVSPVPVTLTYEAPAPAAATFMRAVNEGIASQVHESGGRLAGLGTVPLQDVDRAIVELERVVNDLGLIGVEIGTVIAGRELDDPSLADFFTAADELGARLSIHPMDGGTGVVRRAGQPYDFGLGMLTDTALAAGALVFGGVLQRNPSLTVLLAHGGGSFAWAYPRMKILPSLSDDTDYDALVRRLFVDTLVFDPAHVPLLVHRFGADRVALGTDFPFFPRQEEANASLLAASVSHHGVDDETAAAVGRANALAFLSTSGAQRR